MKDGKLLAEDVLPKLGRVMREMANQNDALNKSLQTTKVAQNRLVTAFQKFQNVIFKSGFGDSLTELFEFVTNLFSDLEGLGKVVGSMFAALTKTITTALKIITTPLTILSDLFTGIDEALGGMMSKSDEMSDSVMPKMINGFAGLAAVLLLVNRRLLVITATVTSALFAINEIIALTNEGIRGSIERNLLGGRDVSSLGEATSTFRKAESGQKLSGAFTGAALVNPLSAINVAAQRAGNIIMNNPVFEVKNQETINDVIQREAEKAVIHGGL